MVSGMEQTKPEVFGYSRKSPDDKQNTDVSISNQNDLIRMVSKDRNWNLNSIEEDKDISGGKTDRRGITIQIERAEKFKKENPSSEVYIMVKDSKRFARNSAFSVNTLIKLQQQGIKVFSITKNGFLDPADLGDRLISVIDEQAIFDGKKYSELSEKLKISKGLPCIPAPFGYKYSKSGEWVINEKQVEIVLGVVQDAVNSVDYKLILKKYRIDKSKYYRIIKNASNGLYSGLIYYIKKYKNSDGDVIRTQEVSYGSSHPHLISKELFEKVNTKN